MSLKLPRNWDFSTLRAEAKMGKPEAQGYVFPTAKGIWAAHPVLGAGFAVCVCVFVKSVYAYAWLSTLLKECGLW